MEASISDGRHELEDHLEAQMRAQELQLVWVRFGMVLVAALFLIVFQPDLEPRSVLFALVGVVALSTLAIPWLLTRFPAREVGIVSTALDMAAVTVAVYIAADAIDAYLFYGLVILGTALRFGLGASVWSSVVMSTLSGRSAATAVGAAALCCWGRALAVPCRPSRDVVTRAAPTRARR